MYLQIAPNCSNANTNTRALMHWLKFYKVHSSFSSQVLSMARARVSSSSVDVDQIVTLLEATRMDPILDKIGANKIRNSATEEEIRMDSLWEEKPCVIVFFRRFGCVFCRQCAKEICSISPILAAHGVRLIGIGFDEYGADEFMKEGYFDGELYLDPPQANYQALGFRRYGIATMFLSLLNKKLQKSYVKVTASGMKGNLLSGDSFQNGGALVVSSKLDGSKVLLSFRQENPIDYVSNEEVLQVLGIRVTEV